MNTMSLELDAPDAAYRPGDHIGGVMRWEFDDTVEAMELRLCWYTQGKGDRDAKIVHTERRDATRAREERFDLRVPLGPYSFAGRLVSLSWVIELVKLPEETSIERLDLVIGPEPRAVDLGAQDSDIPT